MISATSLRRAIVALEYDQERFSDLAAALAERGEPQSRDYWNDLAVSAAEAIEELKLALAGNLTS